jgi:hypothetical protein
VIAIQGDELGLAMIRTHSGTITSVRLSSGTRADQPMAGETEPVEIRLPLEPVVSDDEWARAQTLLLKRRTWSKDRTDAAIRATARG